MLYRVLVTSLSIALIPAFCKGAEKPAPKPKAKAPALGRIIKRIMAEGWEIVLPPAKESIRGFAGFPEGAKAYGDDAAADQAADGASRSFVVVMDPSTTTARASGILLRRLKTQESGAQEGHIFRATVIGELKQAVRGSRTARTHDFEFMDLNVSTPTVKADFRNEMDFWLKGKGRKKAEQPAK